MFSEFFDTTEAEVEIQKLKSPSAKRARKSKKAPIRSKEREHSSGEEVIDGDESGPEEGV